MTPSFLAVFDQQKQLVVPIANAYREISYFSMDD